MEPLLSLSCPDDARRAAIAQALVRVGLEVTIADADLASIHILDDRDGLLIHSDEEVLVQLTVSPSPDDIAGLARLGLELTTLWGLVRAFEDSEAAGVIAADVVYDARNALTPVLFAANALAVDYPAAQELTGLVVDGCHRVTSILRRITPVERITTAVPTCANVVIGELLGTMKLMARQARLSTRLESPLPPVAITRSELERMLLTLVANAADARRNSSRIIVATSSRVITTVEPRGVPVGDWVVIEVDDDGTADQAARERALKPTFVSPSAEPIVGLGLPSIARVTRAAGGHVSIDNKPRGVTIGLWLPRVV